jgi:hypothetical protein
MNHPPETTTSPRLPSRRVERAAVPSGPQIRPATHHLAGAAAASAAALILLSVSTMPRLTWRPLGTGSSVRRLITGHQTNWKDSASKVPVGEAAVIAPRGFLSARLIMNGRECGQRAFLSSY